MYSAPRSIQAVALAFVYFVSGSAAFPQTPKFIRRTADPLPLANVRLAPPRCAGDSRSPAADLRATIVLAEDATSTCDSSPRADASLVNPCNSSSGVRIGCNAPSLANVIEIPNEGGLRISVAYTCYASGPTWVTRCPRRLLRCCMNSVMCLISSQEMETTKTESLRRTQVKSCVFAARLSNPKENGARSQPPGDGAVSSFLKRRQYRMARLRSGSAGRPPSGGRLP